MSSHNLLLHQFPKSIPSLMAVFFCHRQLTRDLFVASKLHDCIHVPDAHTERERARERVNLCAICCM